MKILVVMEAWDAPAGPWQTLFRDYRSVLEGLGHEVRVVDNKRNYAPVGGATVWQYPRWVSRLRLHHVNDGVVNALLLRQALSWRPDLLLLSKCENVWYRTLAQIRRRTDAVIVNWDHDNPFWFPNSSISLLRSIPILDAFFAFSRVLVPVLEHVGCRRAEVLPMFFHPERFPSTPPSDDERARFACDIAFIGSPSPERIAWLEPLADLDLGLWGSWDRLPASHPLRARWRGPVVGPHEYARILQSSRIGLNVFNASNRHGSNTRTFEVTGLGAFLLTERSEEQSTDLFREGEEIVSFRTPTELREKATHHLAHEDERRRIAAAGQARTLREHTLEQRLRRIMTVVDEIRAGKTAPAR